MLRRLLAVLVGVALTVQAVPQKACAATDAIASLVPYSIEPIWVSLYDDQTEQAFFPSKGIYEYPAKEDLPGGYVTPPPGGLRGLPQTFFASKGTFIEDYTHTIFALIKLKIINRDDTKPFRRFEGEDFYLEGSGGAIYRPHPFTIATAHRLAYPQQAIFMTLGFEAPVGNYTLVYHESTPMGHQIQVEVWRYELKIDRGVLNSVGQFIAAVPTAVGGVLLFAYDLLFKPEDIIGRD